MKISLDVVDFGKRKAICIFVCMIFIGTGFFQNVIGKETKQDSVLARYDVDNKLGLMFLDDGEFVDIYNTNMVPLQKEAARYDTDEKYLKEKNHIVDTSLQSITSKKWTFMFYDDADFPGYDPLVDTIGGLTFAEAAYSGENVDVIVLQDIENGPATMWYVDESHNIEKLEDMGEVNMANCSTLKNFVEYCKDEYPAERYVLAIYNHGGGIWGACIDYASNGDILTMDEMQKALTESGGVDILCFSAPCLMGAVECVYELRDCVDVYVGSEENSGYTLWHDAMGSLCDTLNENPDISNIDLGEKIIEWIEEDAKTNIKWGSLLSMSAIRTDKIKDLVTSIDELSIYLNENFNDITNNIRKARRKTREVGRHILHWFEYRQRIDLIDFIQKYNEIESDPIISQHLQNITEAFNEAVIKECHRFWHRKTNGLSIYFPMTTRSYGYSSTYHNVGYGLDFPQDTHWDEFLLKYKDSEFEVFYTFFPFLRPRISL